MPISHVTRFCLIVSKVVVLIYTPIGSVEGCSCSQHLIKPSTFDVLGEPARRQILTLEVRGMDYLKPSVKSSDKVGSGQSWSLPFFGQGMQCPHAALAQVPHLGLYSLKGGRVSKAWGVWRKQMEAPPCWKMLMVSS